MIKQKKFLNQQAKEQKKQQAAGTKVQPFFLYLPFQGVHEPLQVPEKYLDMYPKKTGNDKIKAAMLTALDDAIGSIITTLKSTPLYTNTIIVFTSDNGAPPGVGGSNAPLRGHKHQLWEGGLRVPAFFHAPSLLDQRRRGTIHTGLFHVSDWLPTLVNLAGGNTIRNKPIDGLDIFESLSTGSPSPRTELIHDIVDDSGSKKTSIKGPHKAVRVGRYKYLTEPPSIPGNAWKHYFYDIISDKEEQHNLADSTNTTIMTALQHAQDRLKFYANDAIKAWVSDPSCVGPLAPHALGNGSKKYWGPYCDPILK